MPKKLINKAAKRFIQFDDSNSSISRNKPLNNFIMSVNGVQKCVMLKIYKQLENNTFERLKDMARILGLSNWAKEKDKTELLIRICSFIGTKKNEPHVKSKLPKSIWTKIFEDEIRV